MNVQILKLSVCAKYESLYSLSFILGVTCWLANFGKTAASEPLRRSGGQENCERREHLEP